MAETGIENEICQGQQSDIQRFLEVFAEVAGSDRYNPDLQQVLQDGDVTTSVMLTDTTTMLTHVGDAVQPLWVLREGALRAGTAMNVLRIAVQRYRTESNAGGAAAAGQAGVASGGSADPASQAKTGRTGEKGEPLAKSTFVQSRDRDGVWRESNTSVGAADILERYLHLFRVWPAQRTLDLLGTDFPKFTVDKLFRKMDTLNRDALDGRPMPPDWATIRRLEQIKSLRVINNIAKRDRLIGFELTATQHWKLSVADFLPDGCHIDLSDKDFTTTGNRTLILNALSYATNTLSILFWERRQSTRRPWHPSSHYSRRRS
jgi:hypothetical protein